LGFINVYPMRYSFVADHFQYLAAAGLMVLVATGITVAFRKFSSIRMIVYVVLLLALATLTWRQCEVYHDEETLWRVTLQKNPNSWMAADNLGLVLIRKGQLNEVIGLEQKALALNPDTTTAYDNLGFAFF